MNDQSQVQAWWKALAPLYRKAGWLELEWDCAALDVRVMDRWLDVEVVPLEGEAMQIHVASASAHCPLRQIIRPNIARRPRP